MVKALGDLAGQAPAVMAFLNGFKGLLLNLIALVQTIGQSILKTFGVDLPQVMDPKAVQPFFDAIWEGIKTAIRGFFSFMRVAGEVGRIVQSAFQDIGDAISDLADNAKRLFRRMGTEIGFVFRDIALGALQQIRTILEALSTLPGGERLFRESLDKANDRIVRMTARKFGPAGMRGSDATIRAGLDQDDRDSEIFRNNRWVQRRQEDLRRDWPWWDRIRGAAAGATGFGGEMERDFFTRLEQNRAGLFAPPAIPPAAPAAPSFVPPPFRGGSSVQVIPGIPVPASPFPIPYNGANAPLLSPDAIYRQQYGGGAVNFNGPITIAPGADIRTMLRDPVQRRALAEEFLRNLDESARSGGVSGIDPGFGAF